LLFQLFNKNANSIFQISSAEVGIAEGSIAEVGFGEVGTAEAVTEELGTVEFDIAEVNLTKLIFLRSAFIKLILLLSGTLDVSPASRTNSNTNPMRLASNCNKIVMVRTRAILRTSATTADERSFSFSSKSDVQSRYFCNRSSLCLSSAIFCTVRVVASLNSKAATAKTRGIMRSCSQSQSFIVGGCSVAVVVVVILLFPPLTPTRPVQPISQDNHYN
jgi:hypothetical protein